MIVDIQKREIINSIERPETGICFLVTQYENILIASLIAMKLSSDNKYLVTSSKDNKTSLWDFEFAKLIYTIPWDDTSEF